MVGYLYGGDMVIRRTRVCGFGTVNWAFGTLV